MTKRLPSVSVDYMPPRALVLILCLLCRSATTAADVVEDRLLPLLGVHNHAATFVDPWLGAPAPGVTARFIDEDLLRRYVDGARVVDLGRRSASTQATLLVPGSGHGSPQWLRIEIDGDTDGHTARSPDHDWTGTLHTAGRRMALGWRRQGATHLVAAALAWQTQHSDNSTIDIAAFHRSDNDPRMNRYFWDLLEPTFGDHLRYRLDQQRLRAASSWRTSFRQGTQIGLQASWQRDSPDVRLWYTNKGDREELRGQRTSSIDQAVDEERFVLGLQQQLHVLSVRLQTGLTRRRATSLTQQQDVPRSDSGVILDVIELGRGAADQSGPDISLSCHWQPAGSARVHGSVTWARATVTADGEGHTPVLGFSLRTLPVAHSGSFALSGRLTTRSIAIGGDLRGRRFGWKLNAMALRSQYRGQIVADTRMEFGLIVAPVDQALAYDLRLYGLSLASRLRLSPKVDVSYRLSQYIGDLSDRAALPLPDDDVTEFRGGRVHTLSLYYHL